MEKDSFIKARISSATKTQFEDICQELNVQPTTKVRDLIEQFVRDESERLNEQVTVIVDRPPEYQLGAWRVTVRLRNPADLERWGVPVPFAFPELPKRRLHPDDGYLAVVRKNGSDELVIGGQFVKGIWHGHLYSNGVLEDENPTSIEAVKTALRETAAKLIERFGRMQS
ncbi:hypothetical protein N182_34105 [Sinorhizobium sp. GL2]|nr:hypothetical protein N182_34105 [Sinorhizobium sp. GL2]